MDSKVLSQEQIRELVLFIHSRGFRAPYIVLEILDHFACKVEEILEQKPDIQFYQAMVEAHLSFGVRGFYPFFESFQQHTEKKYKKLFWRNFRSELGKPYNIFMLSLFGVLLFMLYVRASANLQFKIWDYYTVVDVAFFIILLLCPLLDLAIKFSLPKGYRRHPFISSSLMSGSVSAFWFFIFMGPALRRFDVTYPWIFGSIFALYVTYITARHFANKRTIQKAKDDLEAINRMAIDV